jgi:hypothetical protein
MRRLTKAVATRAALAAVAALLYCSEVDAQQMFIDVNGDGRATGEDRITATGAVALDLWIETNRNRDGSRVQLPEEARPLTINHYEFVLRAVNGTVEWGSYRNLIESMAVPFGPRMNATEYYMGFGGLEPLAPGKYKLGTLTVTVKTGNPRIAFASSSSLWGSARTSFGSQYSGKDGDNTLKFTDESGEAGLSKLGFVGDWFDATGLESEVAEPNQAMKGPVRLERFAVSVAPNPARQRVSFEVMTTRTGRVRIEVFDVTGRLVSRVMNEAVALPGVHKATMPTEQNGRRLASGVYMYRVETAEGTSTGRIVLLK